jgi:hypothetical protein
MNLASIRRLARSTHSHAAATVWRAHLPLGSFSELPPHASGRGGYTGNSAGHLRLRNAQVSTYRPARSETGGAFSCAGRMGGMKFSIRDVLWLTVVVALGVGWGIERRLHLSSAAKVQTLETKVAEQNRQIKFLNRMW